MWDIRDDGHALANLINQGKPFCVNKVERRKTPPPLGDKNRDRETHAACYVGHRTDHRCVGKNPGGELREGDTGKDADEQLVGQSLFDPALVKDGICTLWFAAVYIYSIW